MPRHKEGEANTFTAMTIQTEIEDSKGGPLGTAHSESESARPMPCSDDDFYKMVAPSHPDGVRCAVFAGANGAPTDHIWKRSGGEFSPWVVPKVKNRKPAYVSMAVFNPNVVDRYKGRAVANVVGLHGWVIDVEGTVEKGGYEGMKGVVKAVNSFISGTRLIPNFVVSTGSGGMHLHFVADRWLTVAEWLPRAKALVALAAKHGLRIDAPVTTDPARVIRAPGSIHQKTDEKVVARAWRKSPYTSDFDSLIGYVPGEQSEGGFPNGGYANLPAAMDINADILGPLPKYSARQMATHCPAFAKAIEHNGRDTSYSVWTIAALIADRSIEGREYAHAISSGHKDYDPAKTDRKIDSFDGGPPSCEKWQQAYGSGGPCDTCPQKGRLKNPAVQLGGIPDTSAPGALAESSPDAAPKHIAELNAQYAVVINGVRPLVMDSQTPIASVQGVSRGVGFMGLSAFRQKFSGRYAPIEKVGEKPRALADVWLSHPVRRQYEGMVYAPGDTLPPGVFNLWQGFAVTPAPGDVSVWLELLETLIPNASERNYVLRWLAWKIQNPGGVPDTILIFKGAKGTGKNSLFDPLLTAFGSHGMLADDPELIAGRFTWHLIDKSLVVLDEAVFIGDPRQSDRIKSRVTAKIMLYEQKGMDPVQGVNRCAFVMLTNHEHVWQATPDERRSVIIEAGEGLRGNHQFWGRYHAWVKANGPAALLHYLQSVDLTGFNPRQIPKGEALRKQIEQTALRSPAAAWWYQCLTDGAIRWRADGERLIALNVDAETQVDRAGLRMSYEQSAGVRGGRSDWAAVARRLVEWAGPQGIQKTRLWVGGNREWHDVFPPLQELRAAFTAFTQVKFDD